MGWDSIITMKRGGTVSEVISKGIGSDINDETVKLWAGYAKNLEQDIEWLEERLRGMEEARPMTAEINEKGVMHFDVGNSYAQEGRLLDWFREHKHDKFSDIEFTHTGVPVE